MLRKRCSLVSWCFVSDLPTPQSNLLYPISLLQKLRLYFDIPCNDFFLTAKGSWFETSRFPLVIVFDTCFVRAQPPETPDTNCSRVKTNLLSRRRVL